MKKIFISGCFNVVHPGHIRLLKFGKESGDYLIIGVASDRVAKDAAFVPEKLRLDNVKAITWVDECFIYDESLSDVILKIKPDIVLKGKEYEFLHNPEEEIINSYGGKLVFDSGDSLFSSSELISRDFNNLSKNNINLHQDFLKNHSISKTRLIEIIRNFENLKVLVVGDTIIDRYINCNAVGMSREDPVLVVNPVDTAQFIGGAAIVAAHASAMGSVVNYISVIGNDEEASFVNSQLELNSVKTNILIDELRPTNLKIRYRTSGRSLLRVNRLHSNDLPSKISNELINRFKKIVKDNDIIIFSDFNYGCLSTNIVDQFLNIANENKSIFIAADSQSSSQIGNLNKFKNVDLINATEYEARLATSDLNCGLVVLSTKLKKICNSKNILLKLGSDGVLISEKVNDILKTDTLKTFNNAPVDVAGAGDSMLVASSMALYSGANIWEAAYLGSLAAGIQISRVGNIPVSSKELIMELKN